MSRKLLGIGAGRLGGSAEILLVAAMRGAETAGATAELVQLEALDLENDADRLWEQLVACDALIISTPIISRAPAASLKAVGDRLLGPHADAAFVEGLLADAGAAPFRVDRRVLKPRVGGLIAVGGSLTDRWKTLTLPLLHTFTLPMHIAVVDQVQFAGAGTPQSIVLDDTALERAAQLGHNVGTQIGRTFEEAEYVGDPGLCPMCHLDVVVLRGREVECATCGALGELSPDHTVRWTDLTTSLLTMDEKRAHFAEVRETAMRQAVLRDEIDDRARGYDWSVDERDVEIRGGVP